MTAIRGGIQIYWGRQYAPVVLPHFEPLMTGRCFLSGAATFRETGTGDGDRILPFVTRVDIGAPPWSEAYTADVTTWVTEDGKPVGEWGYPGDEPAVAGGEAVTAVFRYILGFGGTDSGDPFAAKAAQRGG